MRRHGNFGDSPASAYGAQPQHQENPKPGYENSHGMQTYEGFEQKLMDDITRLAKDQIAAEDAEIARHREVNNLTLTNFYGTFSLLI